MDKLKHIIYSFVIFMQVFHVSNAWAQSPGEVYNGLPIYESSDVKLFLDARINLDGAWYQNALNHLNGGTAVRRARMALKGYYGENVYAEFDLELNNNAKIQDLYLRYKIRDGIFIQAGNFKEPFGLERLTSSKNIFFIERSYLDAFAPGRSLGAAMKGFNNYWFAMAGIFGKDVNSGFSNTAYGWATTYRLLFVPLNNDQTLAQFGFSASKRWADNNGKHANAFKFLSYPETSIDPTAFLKTEWIENIEYLNKVGLEGLFSVGPFSVQSELMQTDIYRQTGDVHTLHGWYAAISYILTGEHKYYIQSDAEQSRVIPNAKRGAFELVARYSNLDLNNFDGQIFGGEAENVTLGLNWYANKRFRAMLNVVYVNNDRYADGNGSLYSGDIYAPAGKAGDDFFFTQLRLDFVL